MIRKLSVSLAALAAMGIAGAASANISYIDENGDPANSADVTINVTVEDIAILEVLDGSGEMVIDDNSDNTMGNPTSSLGTPTGGPASNVLADYAQIRLKTNFQPSSIEIAFPFTNDIRDRDHPNWVSDPDNATFNGTPYQMFGVATGDTNSNTLGVFPQVYLSSDFPGPGGGGSLVGTSPIGSRDMANGGPWIISTPPVGLTDYAIGVSTNWSRTKVGEPLFAEPDTYSITMTATLQP